MMMTAEELRNIKEPMTPEQRAACFAALDRADPRLRKNFEGRGSAVLAAGVLQAWPDSPPEFNR